MILKQVYALLFFMTMLLASNAFALAKDDGIYPWEQKDNALAFAEKNKQPVMFILTVLDSKCPKCKAAMESLKKLAKKEKVTVVICDHVKNHHLMPEDYRNYLDQKKLGSIVPRGFITAQDGKKHLIGFSYADITTDQKSTFRTIKKAIKENK